MSTTLRNILIGIGILILIGVIGVIVYFTQVQQDEAPDITGTTDTTTPGTTTTTTPSGEAGTPTVTSPNTDTIPVDDENAALRLARTVVERYGTFSNENNYENITSIQPFLTERFQNATNQLIASDVRNENDAYYGITTSVLSVDIVSSSDESATVRVITQRVEQREGEENNVFTQEAVARLDRVDTGWKVDAIDWQ